MQIACLTTGAASQVLNTLMDRQLRPGRDFHLNGPELPDPPIQFVLHVDLPGAVVRHLRGIPDASITEAT